MLFRYAIVLISVIAFINGCSSLISRVGGTHKLRTYTMEEVIDTGIGDADYIQVSQANRLGQYSYTPVLKRGYKPVLAYPVLSEQQADSVAKGLRVHPAIIAWTQRFDTTCVAAGNCLTPGKFTLEGITSKIDRERNRVADLAQWGYQLPETPIYIEIDRKPLDWYWNLAIMLVALLLGGGTELYYSRKYK
jgi:hypothetical protein